MILAQLHHVEILAPNIRMFWFEPNRTVHFQAGQFTDVALAQAKHDPRGISRQFTLSSSPTESLLAITTKFGSTLSVFKQALLNLKPGDEIKITEPMGDFVLPKDATRSLVFIAAGIGITPVRSIIKSLTDSKEGRDISIYYRPAKPSELIYDELFSSYACKYRVTKKRLNAEMVISQEPDLQQKLIYISGPEHMAQAISVQLQVSGIDSGQIVTDYFLGYDIN